MILTEAWKKGQVEGDETLPSNLSLPGMTFQKMVPMMKGLNTHALASSVPSYIQANRKVLHLEVGRTHADLINGLIRAGKCHGLFEKYWGK